MKDELDGLSDSDLTAVFAREVAGWHNIRPNPLPQYGLAGTKADGGVTDALLAWNPLYGIPPYATSADAVIPWLEKAYVEYGKHLTDATGKPGWFMRVFIGNAHGEYVGAPTFARAACISFLLAVRASRAQKP